MPKDHRQFRLSRRAPTSEFEAWLAGLLITDGYANKNSGILSLTLTVENAMRMIADQLDLRVSVNKQVDRKPAFRVNMSRLPTCWRWSVPDLPNSLNRHYWRGVIDGDGCVTTSGNASLRVLLLVRVDEALYDSYTTYLKSIKTRYSSHAHSTSSMVRTFEVTGVPARDLANLLYSDTEFAIQRKQRIALCSS